MKVENFGVNFSALWCSHLHRGIAELEYDHATEYFKSPEF